jgi:hypothetical protein
MPFCPNCGKEVSSDDNICNSCGELLFPAGEVKLVPIKKQPKHRVAKGIAVAIVMIISIFLAGVFIFGLDHEGMFHFSPESDLERMPVKTRLAREKINETFPDGYYNFIGIPPFASKRGLATVLEKMREYSNFIDLYSENVFDCSEMAALVEATLEQYGFETYIVTGACPWNPEEPRHAWCLVKDPSSGELFPLECTSLRIPDEHYYNYFLYDQRFNDIYEACGHSYDDFDWWNSEELGNIKFYIGKFIGREVCLPIFNIFNFFHTICRIANPCPMI